MDKLQKAGVKKGKPLRSVSRPVILESKNTKTDLIMQARMMGSVKKGKANMDLLPEGIRSSLESKNKLDSIIKPNSFQVEDIVKKLDITKKPLNLKSAKVHKDELNARFEKNRSKSGVSKGITLEKLNLELRKGGDFDEERATRISEGRKPATRRVVVEAAPIKNKKVKK